MTLSGSVDYTEPVKFKYFKDQIIVQNLKSLQISLPHLLKGLGLPIPQAFDVL